MNLGHVLAILMGVGSLHSLFRLFTTRAPETEEELKERLLALERDVFFGKMFLFAVIAYVAWSVAQRGG